MPADQSGPRRRPVPSRSLIAVAIVLGALLGGWIGQRVVHHDAQLRAAALLDLTPAMSLPSGSPPGTDDADRFIQSELLYLNSDGFAGAVTAAAGRPPGVTLSAAQVGSTNVVQLSAVGPAAGPAERVADVAVSVYAAHRRAVLTGEVGGLQAQLAAAQKDLAAVQAQAAAQAAQQAAAERAGTVPPVTAQVDASAAQDRVNTLQGQIDAAQAAAASGAAGGTVVESAASAGASPTSSRTLGLALGAACGALLGLLVAALVRMARGRFWYPGDGAEGDVPILRPELPRARRDWLARLPTRVSDDPVEAASRLIAGQLAESLAEGRPLVIVGAGPGTGASFTAVNLAAALSRRRRTVLVAAGDVADGQVAAWFDVTPEETAVTEVSRCSSVATVEAVLARTPVLRLRLLTVPQAGRWEPVEDALAGQAVPLLLAQDWTVVIDCPRPSVSTAAFDLAPLHPVIGVVAARGRTRPGELTATLRQLDPDEKSVPRILVNRKPRRLRSWIAGLR